MKNFAESNRAKLFSLSKDLGVDFSALLIRFATDRLLYRLSLSKHHRTFVLKGSLLFSVWNEEMHRPTKDADLLGFGTHEESQIRQVFSEVCSMGFQEDGLIFDLGSMSVATIRDEEKYDGSRVKVKASLDGADVTVQIDIGFGDVITPAVESIVLPTYLGMPPAKLQAYPKETVVSEKTEALVKLGIANSRMKDLYDIKWLADHYEFNGKILATAISSTFERRKTRLPVNPPVALTDEFYRDGAKQRQWSAFARKLKPNCLDKLDEVGARVMQFLLPPLRGALEGNFDHKWTTNHGWLTR